MAYETSMGGSWALYAQEQPGQRDHAQYQHHQPVYALPAPDKAYLANSAPDVTDARSRGGIASEELYGYAASTEGYGPPAYTFAPQRTASYGTTPSPGLPALSPSSATSFSSSSFSSTVSPLNHVSAATTPELQRNAGLLPPACIDGGGGGEYALQQDGREGGFFASAQDSCMQQQQHCAQYEGQPTQYPPSSSAFVLPPAAPPTPRRHPPASNLYRSPSAYSVASTPTTSPYYRPSTPRSALARRRSVDGLADSPTKRATPRKVQAVTTSVDANGSSTKTVRRVARLSIEVLPVGQRGPAPLSAPPNSLPPPSWATAPPSLPHPPAFALQSEPLASSPSDQVLSEAAVREVEQLLGELGPILETGVYEQVGGLNDESYVQLSPRARVRLSGESYVEDGRAPSMSVSISGVTLGEEDLALLEDPSLTSDVYDSPSRSYPASAPAWRTTFDLPPATPPPVPALSRHYASQNDQYLSPTTPVSTYTLSHSASMNSLALPPNPHQRAYSAQGHLPRSASSHDPFLSSSPPRASSSVLRRRSSVDSVNLAASYGRYPYPPPLPQQHQQQQPFPAVLQPAPPQGAARPSTPPPKPAQTNSKSPSKTTPKRKRGSPTKAKQPAAMFINYSSQDAKKLLSGVAPSGSSKKKREEDEARQRALEEAQRRGYAAGIASASPASVAASRSSSSGSAA
ncbi:proteophosphoglycan ppg4 [Rhodotorula toruloides]|uniref:Proteophosphoglycan ppg4 n=1 Tax=Rhodotorula toruloides TaxID=5286 RepID=A0A511KBQ8_RHOTO|nr:proteophosphoglycan ppg4 [Rhodotorula toruloides]